MNYSRDYYDGSITRYAYTAGGRLTGLTDPSGRTVDYTYDFQSGPAAAGHVWQVSTTYNGATTVLASNIAYYPFGPVASLNYGNGLALQAQFDSAYRPTLRTDGVYAENITNYDGAGNILARTVAGSQGFTYDPLSRLQTATATGGFGSLSWLYDPNGNRQSETRNGTNTTYTYSTGTNRLAQAGAETRQYHPDGSTAATASLGTLSYNGYGELTQIATGASSYAYDPFGRRHWKNGNGNSAIFTYGPNSELLYEMSNGSTKSYVYLNGTPLARIDDNANIYYYHSDHLGTPQAMTDATGTTVWRAAYEPFGKATVTISTITNNLRFPGQYFDAETGLHYNNARYYDPKVGGYITSDPIGLAGGLNTYSYVYNNPLSFIDPLGLWSPGGHDALYNYAFIGLLDPSEITIIQQESRALDKSTGVGVSTAYIHSMRKPFQSAQVATAASKKYICEKLKQAGEEPDRVKALKYFADAAHTITDSFSPEHTDTSGAPRLWYPLLFAGHSPNDHVGNETVKDITTEIYQKSMAALIDAYNQAFSGNSSNNYCGCQ